MSWSYFCDNQEHTTEVRWTLACIFLRSLFISSVHSLSFFLCLPPFSPVMEPDPVSLVSCILFIVIGCRMDDAEACFILSNRFEVDRFAAVRFPPTPTYFPIRFLYSLISVRNIGSSKHPVYQPVSLSLFHILPTDFTFWQFNMKWYILKAVVSDVWESSWMPLTKTVRKTSGSYFNPKEKEINNNFIFSIKKSIDINSPYCNTYHN